MKNKTADPSVATAEDKRLAFAKMADEAGGFYTMATTITTAFLGGALYFCDKFLATGPKWSIVPLSAGALLLAAALVMLCWVRWNNVNCLQMYLESLQPDGACERRQLLALEGRNRILTTTALVVLATGLAAIVLFCIACVWNLSQGPSS